MSSTTIRSFWRRFAADIRPPFISAEAHTIEVFDTLRRSGGYGAFKIVNGNAVGQLKDLPIETSEGVQPYTFPEHSAGPFGSDIPGPWHSSARFRRRLIMEKPGWKDVHATSVFPPDPHAGPTLLRYGVRRLRKSLRETKRKMRNSRKPAVDRP